jgi:hypothetical protein
VHGTSAPLARFLYLLALGGMLGLTVELLLLAHTEDLLQWIPILLLGAGVAVLALCRARPTPGRITASRLTMALLVLAGLGGAVLHYLGNREFQLETDPSLGGLALAWKVVRAHSPPALAPGAMALVGLVGIAWTMTVSPRSTT